MILLVGFLAIFGYVVEQSKPEYQQYLMKISVDSDSKTAAQNYCGEGKTANIIELGTIEGDSKSVRFTCGKG